MKNRVISLLMAVCMTGILGIGNVRPVSAEEMVSETEEVLGVTVSESEDTRADSITAQADSQIYFTSEYPAVGKELGVEVTGMTGNLSYEWKVDGVIKGRDAAYTPLQEDLEKFISVTVKDSKGSSLSKQVFFSRLPVIYINTENGAVIGDKENYITSEFIIQGNETYNSETTTLYNGTAGVRGRGNSTWSLPKKPYKVKLDKGTDLFGFGKSKHWVLLANYYDTSFIRNKLAYDLSGDMGIPYMQSVLADVVLNGVYVGNYQLCEQVRSEEGRVDVTDWEDVAADAAKAIVKAESLTDEDQDALEEQMTENLTWITSDKVDYAGSTYTISEYYQIPDIEGGYILELDTYMDEVSIFYTDKNQPMMFKEPEYANTNEDMMNYVRTYIQAFEDAVYADDYKTEYNGEVMHYSDFFDMDSLVDYWIVQEIFFNIDSMKNSTYMYKQHGEKFKMGPVWDMDCSSGASPVSDLPVNQWQTLYFSAAAQENQWYKELVKDPYFLREVYNRYWEIRDTYIQNMLDSIDTLSAEIKESAEASLDLWRLESYESARSTLKTWMTDRIAFLDQKMDTFDTFAAEFLQGNKKIEVFWAYEYPAEKDTVSEGRSVCDFMTYEKIKTFLEIYNEDRNIKRTELWYNGEKYSELYSESWDIYELQHFLYPKEDGVVQLYTYDEYGNVLDSYYCTVKLNKMVGLEVIPPEKYMYKIGEELDETGMEVYAVYDSGIKRKLFSYGVSPLQRESGVQTIDVKCWEMSDSFDVIVMGSGEWCNRIRVLKGPDKDTYILGEELDLTGLVIAAELNDGTLIETTNYRVSEMTDELGVQTITVYSNWYQTTFDVCVVENAIPLEDISLKTARREMIIGEKIPLEIIFTPERTTDAKNIVWKSSDENVLAVNKLGEVFARWPGKATVTATLGDLKVSCDITVYGIEQIYKDITPDLWYYDEANWGYVTGLMTGYGNGTFGGADMLVRAQFATILYRLMGQPEQASYEPIFPDVPSDTFYTKPVLWAAQHGIITGYTDTGRFGPNDRITREQVAAILYRLTYAMDIDTSQRVDISGYPDAANVSAFAIDAMEWAVGTGLIQGSQGYLNPQGNACRAEAITIMLRYVAFLSQIEEM